MKSVYLYLTLTIGFLCAKALSACDMCGPNLGLPNFKPVTSVQMLYRNSIMNITPGSISAANEYLAPSKVYKAQHLDPTALGPYKETYQALELRFNYFILPQFELFSIVPYVCNSNSKDKAQGLGDIVIGGNYYFKALQFSQFTLRFNLGAGIKLPTGSNSNLAADGDLIDPLLQTGTKSTDGIYTVQSSLKWKEKLILQLGLSYKANQRNANHYRVANSLLSTGNLSYKIGGKANWNILSGWGYYYEHCDGLYYYNDIEDGTSVNTVYLGPNIDFNYKSFSIRGQYLFATHNNMHTHGERMMEPASRFNIGLVWRLEKIKPLLRKK